MTTVPPKRNYIPISRTLGASILISGMSLELLTLAGMYSLSSMAFQAMWVVHLLLQTVAVCIVLWLFQRLMRDCGRWGFLYLAIAACAAGLIAIRAVLPITSHEALSYSLALPKFWLQDGRVSILPWLDSSHYPSIVSVAYAGFLSFDLVALTPVYHLSYLILCSGVIAAFVYYKTVDAELAMIGALISITLPMCMQLGSEPGVELASACFFGFFIASFIAWVELRGSTKYLVAIGLTLGLALCTSYSVVTSFIAAIAAGAFFLWRWHYPRALVSRSLLVLCGAALIVCSPWWGRNLLSTGILSVVLD